jgi:enoyl-[acyl-carrier protein] reductase II
MVLIPEVVNYVSKPIVAAEGFADGKSLVAALSLGAIGVQMGTQFIATQESEFGQAWKQLILDSIEEDAMVARGFFGPMRFLKNKRAIELIDATIRGASDLYKGRPCGSTQEILDLGLGGLQHLFDKELDNHLDDTPILGGTICGRIHEIPT